MSKEMTLFKGSKSVAINNDKLRQLQEINKRLGGSFDSVRRISFRGGRFREIVAGEQVRVSKDDAMNIVILDAAPVGRTYYEGSYDADNPTPPRCWSTDGKIPAVEVSEDDRMSRTCAECPMNVKGSGQGDSRACRYSQRLAIAVENKYDTVYQIQLAATSIFGDVSNGDMPMQAYARFLNAHNTPAIAIVTEMYFDEDSETPKLFFKPVRPLEEDELDEVLALAEHEDVKKAITFTVFQSDNQDKKPSSKSEVEEDDEEEPAPKRSRRVIEDEEEEEPAPKRSRRVVEDEEEEEPAPKRRGRPAKSKVDDDDEEEPAPKRRGRPAKSKVDDEEEEPAPKRRGRPAKSKVEDDEEEEPAPKRSRRVVEDDDEEIEEPKVRKSTKSSESKVREPVDLSSLVDEWDDED